MALEKSKPTSAAESLPSELEQTKTRVSALAENVSQTVQSRVAEITKHMEGGPLENLGKTFEKLSEKFKNAWDILCALLAPFGFLESDVEAAMKAPDGTILDAPGEDSDHTHEAAEEGTVLSNAYRIKAELHEHPDWQQYISETASRWDLKPSFIAAVVFMESAFNPKAKNAGSIGFSQALPGPQNEYQRERYEQFREKLRSQGQKPPEAAKADFTDPRTSIDFIGFHIHKKIAEANAAVDKFRAPPFYKLSLTPDKNSSSKEKWLWLAYNNGGDGYVRLRMHLDQKTPETYANLRNFQKDRERKTTYRGKTMEPWEARTKHANHLQDIVKTLDALDRGAEEYVAKFESPPLPGNFRISSPFGPRVHPINHDHRFHNGVDYAAPQGTSVLAVLPGTVERVERDAGANGDYVALRHGDGTSTLYLHLSEILHPVGTHVSAGQKIALSGGTPGTKGAGKSTGPHLHFIFKDKEGIQHNPSKLVEQSLTA